MATGVENLLGYRGNAGLGANPDVPVIDPNANLNVINDIGRTSMLLNAERNAKMFQQKIKDRDTLIDLLASGKIASGEIDDLDRKLYDEAEANQIKAFDEIQGINDTKGIENYMKATNNLRNVTTHAQARNILKKQLRDQLSKTTLPSEQQALKKHIEQQDSKDFWDSIDPYQSHLTFNHAGMNARLLEGASSMSGASAANIPGATTQKTTTTIKGGVPVTTQTSTTGPGSKAITPAGTSSTSVTMETLSPLSTSEKVYDYNKILANSTDSYLHDEQIRHDQDQWRQSIENGDAYNTKSVVDFTNKRIAQYNQERGFQPGQPGFVKPIVMGQDVVLGPDNRFHINMPTSEFAAKTALASIDGPYVQRQTDFNKDIANWQLAAKKEKDANALGWARLAQQRRMNDAKIKALNSMNEDPTPYLIEQWKKNATNIERNGHLGSGNVPISQNMPIEFLKGDKLEVLKPFGAKEIKVNGKVTGYEGGSYKYQYQDNAGKVYDRNDIAQNYLEFRNSLKKAPASQREAYKNIKSVDDYISELINKGVYNYSIEGANGKVTMDQWIQSQKAISNMNQKRGQSSIFNGMEGVIFGPDDSEISIETSSSSSGNPNE